MGQFLTYLNRPLKALTLQVRPVALAALQLRLELPLDLRHLLGAVVGDLQDVLQVVALHLVQAARDRDHGAVVEVSEQTTSNLSPSR